MPREVPILGEAALRSARTAGLFADRDPPELGDVLTGRVAARPSEATVTVCDLTVAGAQDTAIAAFARTRATGAGHPLAV